MSLLVWKWKQQVSSGSCAYLPEGKTSHSTRLQSLYSTIATFANLTNQTALEQTYPQPSVHPSRLLELITEVDRNTETKCVRQPSCWYHIFPLAHAICVVTKCICTHIHLRLSPKLGYTCVLYFEDLTNKSHNSNN
jgi:hypothetical protein